MNDWGCIEKQSTSDQACRFFPATALVQLLQKTKASYELPALIQKLDCYALLVIDDISYVPPLPGKMTPLPPIRRPSST